MVYWKIFADGAARAAGHIFSWGIASFVSSILVKTERNFFVDNIFKDPVYPTVGSIILCDLSPVPGLSLFDLNVEHSGIYVGEGKIIHRTGEFGGRIEEVTPSIFLNRLSGKNAAINVYVACTGEKPISIVTASDRAKQALNDDTHKGYDLFSKNCHNFTKYCITGELDHSILGFTFYKLERLLIEEFELDNWRIWNY